MKCVLTDKGKTQFPVNKDKFFQVRLHPLNPDYVLARVWGRKSWSCYWAGFFKEAKLK
jgi:hypothetical protein